MTIAMLLETCRTEFGRARLTTELFGMRGVLASTLEVRGTTDNAWRPLAKISHPLPGDAEIDSLITKEPGDLNRFTKLLKLTLQP